MENDRFTLPRERFSPRFLSPFPSSFNGREREEEKDVRGRENFHSLSSTPRFVSPFFLSLHASFPRASLGIGRSINPAQIKLSRHRIFNGRCLIYEGERINVSIKLHRVWRPRQLFDPVRDNFSFFSLSIPHLRIHVYIYSTRRNTVDRREFIATSTRSKLPPIYSRHFQRCSHPSRASFSLFFVLSTNFQIVIQGRPGIRTSTRWILIETFSFQSFPLRMYKYNTRFLSYIDRWREFRDENPKKTLSRARSSILSLKTQSLWISLSQIPTP